MAAKRLTKSQVVAELAELSELDKKSINSVFESLGEVIKKQLGPRGPGEFVIPGLLKLKALRKPATKDRPGINPFTKQPMTIKGKPASRKVRATVLKALKDMIQLATLKRLIVRGFRGFLPLAPSSHPGTRGLRFSATPFDLWGKIENM